MFGAARDLALTETQDQRNDHGGHESSLFDVERNLNQPAAYGVSGRQWPLSWLQPWNPWTYPVTSSAYVSGRRCTEALWRVSVSVATRAETCYGRVA